MALQPEQALLFLVGATVAALGFIGAVLGANAILSPRHPTPAKTDPYECGMPPAGPPHVRMPLRYATVAIAFVLFDAEAILLFAVASSVRGNLAAGVAVLGFSASLAAGLVYAWRKGALSWR